LPHGVDLLRSGDVATRTQKPCQTAVGLTRDVT
jgi:hypothetical protein